MFLTENYLSLLTFYSIIKKRLQKVRRTALKITLQDKFRKPHISASVTTHNVLYFFTAAPIPITCWFHSLTELWFSRVEWHFYAGCRYSHARSKQSRKSDHKTLKGVGTVVRQFLLGVLNIPFDHESAILQQIRCLLSPMQCWSHSRWHIAFSHGVEYFCLPLGTSLYGSRWSLLIVHYIIVFEWRCSFYRKIWAVAFDFNWWRPGMTVPFICLLHSWCFFHPATDMVLWNDDWAWLHCSINWFCSSGSLDSWCFPISSKGFPSKACWTLKWILVWRNS